MTPDELAAARERHSRQPATVKEFERDMMIAAYHDIPALLAALDEATALVDDLREGIRQMGDYYNESSWEPLAKRRLPWEAPQSRQEPTKQA
jgi:hypothetical protein